MALIFHWGPLMTQLERQLLCEAETHVHSHVHGGTLQREACGSLPLTFRRLRGSGAEPFSLSSRPLGLRGHDDGGMDRWAAGTGAMQPLPASRAGSCYIDFSKLQQITKIPFHVQRNKYRLSLIL